MQNTVLLFQPDAAVLQHAQGLLAGDGYNVATCRDFAGMRDFLLHERPAAVVLQWQSLEITLELLGLMNNLTSEAAYRIITADREAFSHAVEIIGYGVDDCIRLPLDENEFKARLRLGLRRRQPASPSVQLRHGAVCIDRESHRVTVSDTEVLLAPAEYRLLSFFLENPGRVFSRDEILRRAWKQQITGETRTVDVHVRRLRRALEAHACAEHIVTVRGFGYRFGELSA